MRGLRSTLRRSSAIQPVFHQALSGNKDIDVALAEMDEEVDQILTPVTGPGFEILRVLGALGVVTLVIVYRKRKR